MKLGPIEITYNKNDLKSGDLFLALIGSINGKIISEDQYINEGEFALKYSIVKRKDNEYIDIFDNESYMFRDENASFTILTMQKLSNEHKRNYAKKIANLLKEKNSSLEGNQFKKGDKKVYERIRK